MRVTGRLLEMLLADASAEDLDRLIDEAARDADPGERAALREEHALALRIQEQMVRQRAREAELSALNETARDLSEIRDLDAILSAIVRRARQLLHADMTYLSLNDEAEGASYMKVTDGALTPEFRRLRLPLGTGLLGLVAQTGEPYYTEDYQSDSRFLHRDYIDEAVAGEQIRAILGVPLSVQGKVIGALLAVHRRVRPFPPREVALLTAFAAHAAVAIENARLFEQARAAVADADAANAELRARNAATERAAQAHDRLTDVLARRGGVAELAEVLAEVLGGALAVYDDEGRRLAGATEPAAPAGLAGAVEEARRSGRCVPCGDHWVAVAAAGGEHLGTLVVRTEQVMDLAERRTLERGALVVALVLLFSRSAAEAESEVRGELLADLFDDRPADVERLRERARLQGLELDDAFAVVVAQPPPGTPRSALARKAGALGRELAGVGGVLEGRAVLVVPGDPAATGALVRERLGATVGWVAAPRGRDDAPARLRAAYREARQTLDALLRLGRVGEDSDPGGLGVARLLLGGNGPAELDELVARTLGPVLEYDATRGTALAGTLRAWFATGGALAATAERLHVHPNTVSQRLERVGQLLGDDWRAPGRRLDLQLALQLVSLRGDV